MSLRCVLYLRQSLDPTGMEEAVDRQRKPCRKIAADRGWTIVAEYTDNSRTASNKKKARPAYDDMVAAYQRGEFEALVCWDLDRLTRQPRQLEDWIDAAEENGLMLVTANGEADLTTDGGRLYARIKASVARGEIERKSARQKLAAIQRAERGKVPLGTRLLGYDTRGNVIEDEAKWVREMFARFHAGDSLHSLADWLQSTDVPTRHGGPWNPSTVRTILTNPRYAARSVYNRRDNGDTQWTPGTWPAIVDEGLFDLVGERLGDPRRRTQVGTDRKHLGSGNYLCGICDIPVRSHSGNRYRPPCGHVTRSAPPIDGLVRGVVRKRLAEPDLATILAAPDQTDEAKDLNTQIRRHEARLATIESDYDSGDIDGRRYRTAVEKVGAQLNAARAKRSRMLAGTGSTMILSAPDPVAVFDAAPLMIQRQLVSALMVVRLYPAPRGRRQLDPSTVRIDWIG